MVEKHCCKNYIVRVQSLKKPQTLILACEEERDVRGENVEKTRRGNRRGVSFYLILQILPYYGIGLFQVKKQAAAEKEKKVCKNGNHDNDALVTGKSLSPERKIRRIPGVQLTRSCGNDSLNAAVSHRE